MTTSYKRVFEVSMPGYEPRLFSTFAKKKSRAVALVVGKYIRLKRIDHQRRFQMSVTLKKTCNRLDL